MELLLLAIVLVFETGLIHVALAVQELTLYTRVAWNLQRSAYLCLQVLGLKACTTTARNDFLLYQVRFNIKLSVYLIENFM